MNVQIESGELIETDLKRCALRFGETNGAGTCEAVSGYANDPTKFVGAKFDGSSDYLTRGGGLTGAADSKLLSFSVWLELEAVNGAGRIITGNTTLATNSQTTRLIMSTGADTVEIVIFNAAGVQICGFRSDVLPPGRHHICGSVDLSDTLKRHMYVDDASSLFAGTPSVYTNDVGDFTLADWAIGAQAGGGSKFNGQIYDLWYAPGVYIDFSVTANRRKFRDAAGRPVDLGANGQIPTGTAPLVYMGRDFATWATNKGTGGGFTTNGALTAADVATPSAEKCYNTRKTCPVLSSFTPEVFTRRYARSSQAWARHYEAIPSIESISYTPSVISLGEDLGGRASLNVTFKDHPWSDTWDGDDKYVTERDYIPYETGTYFGKMRARNPFVVGQPLRWRDGVLGTSVNDMDVRYFQIESANGPRPDGRYSLVAKDILKFADGDRSQYPNLSGGKISSDITATSTSITLQPTGIGDADYDASGYLNLGNKEIVQFTRSGDTITITGGTAGRGKFNTTAIAHASGVTVQQCKYFDSVDPADVLATILEDGAGIDPSYIPLSAWQSETDAHFRRLLTRLLAIPTSVRQLVSEIIQQAALAMWTDESENLIKLQVLRAIPTDAETFDSSIVRPGSLTIAEQPTKRISKVWIHYGQINPLLPADDYNNYLVNEAFVDTDAEEDWNDVEAIKPIYAPWIPFGGSSIAERLSTILLSQYRDPPRKFTFEVPRYSGATPTLGEGCRLSASVMQLATGRLEEVPIQIISLKPTPGHWEVTAEESRFNSNVEDLDNRVISIGSNSYNLNLRNIHDETYPAPIGGETVTFIFQDWVEVGSLNAAVSAVVTGTWPSASFTATRSTSNGILTGISDTTSFAVGQAITGPGIPNDARISSIDPGVSITIDKTPTLSGSATLTHWLVTLNLQVEGDIGGKGGKGGNGQGGNDNPGQPGEAGGTALTVTAPVNLTGAGTIKGGGGGGGGHGGDWNGWFGPQVDGGGGGGGAGIVPGAGGTAAALAGSGNNGQPGTKTTGGIGGNGTSGSKAGNGGTPGNGGTNANDAYPGPGGAGGKSVDGGSLLKDSTFSGSFAGSQIN